MKKIVIAVLLLVTLTLLCGCGGKASPLTDEQALTAVRNYCFAGNPTLEALVNDGEYPVYWEILPGDERQAVILYRSYTGAQNRYRIDRTTGDTVVTVTVPGITQGEQRTEESFNARDYLS